jgi:hypothetical protein
MTERVGSNATDGTSARASERSGGGYTLAQVLEREFRELNLTDPQKKKRPALGQVDATVSETKQQPLADPSLAPADDQACDRPMKQAEIGKIQAQQPDVMLRMLWENVHNLSGDGRTALCLSGGGVRSAAFNLGVLQGLARLELLNRFHYLSTVSGGGYIGCWLSAWRHRSEKGISDILRGLSWPDRFGNAEVSPRVPDAIRNLRRSSNYLTPAKGILSPDTWATVVIVGRNLILNHVVIVPLVAALLLIVKLFGAASHVQSVPVWEFWNSSLTGTWVDSLAARYLNSFFLPYLGCFFLPGVFAALGWIIFSIARPSWDVRRVSTPINKRESKAQTWPPRLGIALVLFGATVFGLIVANGITKGGQVPSSWTWERFWVFPTGGAVGSLVAFVLAVGVATVKRALCQLPRVAQRTERFIGFIPEVPPGPVTVATAGFSAVFRLALAAGVAGGAGGLILGAGEELAAYLKENDPTSTALVLSIAPLWFVISYNAGEAVFLGLTARRPSAKEHAKWSDQWGDEEREWVARTAGYLTVFALSISILLLLTLFSPILIKFVRTGPTWTGPFGIAIVGILSALASIGLAASPFSTHFGTASRGVRLPVQKILAVATPIFAGLLTAFLSTAIDTVLFNKPLLKFLSQPDTSVRWFNPTTVSGQRYLLGLAIALAVFSYFAALFVNINRFSLYDLYRMRLTSEFLGASNRGRKPEIWTGFDETDDIPLAELWPPQTDAERRLYPVINAALNMAHTERLEWQERKAVSFVFTPHYCGSGATHDLGFRDTKDYANGIRLGWAMSVSGAAVSPNAGYSTMPGLALLMTLFNLRLGVWSGNPGKAGGESYRLRGPDNALRPLLSEALALTDDQSKFVYHL